MRLNRLEREMLDGQHGEAAAWAIAYQREVGEFFDAADFVSLRLIHISTDRETIGDSGVAFIEELAALEPSARRPRAFAAADFRGFDEETFQFLLPGRDLAADSRRAADALARLGVVPEHAYVNDHSITAPAFGEACGYSGTPSVIYMNALVGARCNFEAGPSTLAAFFTGRVPRYGYHLPEQRLATDAFVLDFEPANVSEWGAVGALLGRRLNSYWRVPAIELSGPAPGLLELNHMALSLASFGSIAMFHVVGITPEAPSLEAAAGGRELRPEPLTAAEVKHFMARFEGEGERLDVVALATPQLTLTELVEVAERLEGRRVHPDTTLLVYTPLELKRAAAHLGIDARIKRAGGRLVHGHDFFATYAKEIREVHGWERLMTHSVKMCNICEGYGYRPTPAPIAACVDSAVAGRILPEGDRP